MVQSGVDIHDEHVTYHWLSTKRILQVIMASFLGGAIFGWATLAVGVYTTIYQSFLTSMWAFLTIHYWLGPATILIFVGLLIVKIALKPKKKLEVKSQSES